MKPLSRCILVFRQSFKINSILINFSVKIFYSIRVLKEKTHRCWARCYSAAEGHLRDLRFSQRYCWSSLRRYALSVGRYYPTFKNIAVCLESNTIIQLLDSEKGITTFRNARNSIHWHSLIHQNNRLSGTFVGLPNLLSYNTMTFLKLNPGILSFYLNSLPYKSVLSNFLDKGAKCGGKKMYAGHIRNDVYILLLM